MLQPYSPQMTN